MVRPGCAPTGATARRFCNAGANRAGDPGDDPDCRRLQAQDFLEWHADTIFKAG
jgi:hypothetical protein